jgi:hypothetical protein
LPAATVEFEIAKEMPTKRFLASDINKQNINKQKGLGFSQAS